MIFLAVAAPTPGRSSSSFSLALLRSTFDPLDCPDEIGLADAFTPNAKAAIVKNIATIFKVLFTVPPELPRCLPITLQAARGEDARDEAARDGPLRP